MLKNFCGLAAFLLLGSTTVAQESAPKPSKYSIKLYNQSHFTRLPSSMVLPSSYHLELVKPTVAFQMKTPGGNFHEVELTGIALRRTRADYLNLIQTDVRSNQVIVAARYEFVIPFIKRATKFQPMIGVGVAPFFNRSNSRYLVSTSYPSRTVEFALAGIIVPRLVYNISPRLYADLNIPFSLFNYRYFNQRIGNPALARDQQRQTEANFHFFPKDRYLRVGLGFRF